MTQETEMLLVVNYKIQCHYHRYDECDYVNIYKHAHIFILTSFHPKYKNKKAQTKADDDTLCELIYLFRLYTLH